MINGCVGTWIVSKFQKTDKCYKENMHYYFRQSILTILFGFINFLFNKNIVFFYQLSVVTIDRQISLIIMTQASKFYEELQNIFLFF
jgi:hypothetical protein